LNIDFFQVSVDDGCGHQQEGYAAVYDPQVKTVVAISGTIRRDLGRETLRDCITLSSLELEGLDDIDVADVLAEALLLRMTAEDAPRNLNMEALLFTVVNEAVHTLQKTLSDFLLTE